MHNFKVQIYCTIAVNMLSNHQRFVAGCHYENNASVYQFQRDEYHLFLIDSFGSKVE